MVNEDDSLLRVSNLTTHFHTADGTVHAVDNVSFFVREGEAVGLVGESGSGKTMTARSLLGLVPPPGKILCGSAILGDIDIIGIPEKEKLHIRGRRISMVFQDPMTFLNPIMSVGDQIAEMVQLHLGLRGKQLQDHMTEALRRVRIPSPEKVREYYPHQLSGGMRQRILIAMAISCSPELMIADEPTSALDVTVQAQILQLMDRVIREFNMALILITHDMSIVAEICDRVYVMYAGQIVEGATVFDLFENPQHPYTRGLLKSVTSITKRVDEFITIPGGVPNLISVPRGCRFQPRCPISVAKCLDQDPVDAVTKNPVRFAACWMVMEEHNC